MKNKKLIILILIICVMIIITILGIVILKNTNYLEESKGVKDERSEYLKTQENPAQVVNGKKPNRTSITNLFVTTQECIKSYFSMIKARNSEVLISYLNDNYIKEKNINENNIFEFIGDFKDYNSYRTIEMYDLGGMNYSKYYVKGKIDANDVYFEVGMDSSVETFDIAPISKEEYEKSIIEPVNASESNEKTISKKTYNFYRNAHITNEDLARMYYVDYIKLMFQDTEQAYLMLNEEYRKSKFGNINDFKNYINNNKEFLLSTYNVETADTSNYNNYSEYYKYVESKSDFKMKNYSVNNYNEYTQCVCGNITGSNWIFNVKYPMDYEVYLDSYTIDLPEFTEKYNKQTQENKIVMNIEKVKAALNTGDYNYVYKKLDETFKKNKFANQQVFEQYMKNSLFVYNIFEYDSVKKEGEIYIANINITDATGKNNTKKSMNIIMKLIEGNNYVMSFSFK